MTAQPVTIERITRATHTLPEIAALFRPPGSGRIGCGIACWVDSSLASAPGLNPHTLSMATRRLARSEAVAIRLTPTAPLELSAGELDTLWRGVATDIAVRAKTLIFWSANTGLTILGYGVAPCGTRLDRRLAWFSSLERPTARPEATWPVRMLVKTLDRNRQKLARYVDLPATAPIKAQARSARSRAFDRRPIIRYPWQTPFRGSIEKQRHPAPRNFQERNEAVHSWWITSKADRVARRHQWAGLPRRFQHAAATPPGIPAYGKQPSTQRLRELANIIQSTTSAGPRAYPMHLAHTSSWRFSMFEPDILYHPDGAVLTGIAGIAERLWGSFGLDGSPVLRAWTVLGLSPREATMLIHFDDIEFADDEWPLLLQSITALHAERVLRTKAAYPTHSLKAIWADVLTKANLIAAHSNDRWTMIFQARAQAERAYSSLCDEVQQNLPARHRSRDAADTYLWAQHRAGALVEFAEPGPHEIDPIARSRQTLLDR